MKDTATLAEKSVLTRMLADDRTRRRAFGEGITSDHFASYPELFRAMHHLHRSGDHVDAATVEAQAVKEGKNPAEAFAEVEALTNFSADPGGWSSWVKILRHALALRIARDGSAWLSAVDSGETAKSSSQSILDAVSTALAGPANARMGKEAARQLLEHLQEIRARGGQPGLETGIPQLDAISGGMRPGELWNCLAKTSRGKTVLLLQIAQAVAREGKKVAIFSAEMMCHELVARLVSNRERLDLGTILNPASWSENDLTKVKRGLRAVADYSIWIDDMPRLSIDHIEAESQRLADANDGLDLVVVDYIQIIKTTRSKGESREQEIARISGSLKQLAKQLRCPVISAAQLNSQGETRESAAIAFDSDAMLYIADDGIKIGKMRNGRRDDVITLKLNGEHQRFEHSHQ